jgi:ribonuclease HI
VSGTARRFAVYVDGASKGNPGPAGAGVVIETDDGTVIHEAGYYIGRTTNNVAEYYALLIAVEELLILRADEVSVFTDSELMAHQFNGVYKVKSPALKFIHGRIKRLVSAFKRFDIRHLPRDGNKRADSLASRAAKEQEDVEPR